MNGGNVMEEKLRPLLEHLPQWQHSILDFLIQTKEEYETFMDHYYNKTIESPSTRGNRPLFGKVYRSMQNYRLDRIELLSLSFEDFERLYENDPYKGLTTLFQHGLPKWCFKRAQENLLSGEQTLKRYYEYSQIDPDEFLFRIVNSRLDEEHMEWMKKRQNQKKEAYEEQNDVIIEIPESLNSKSKNNLRTNRVVIHRMIRDTKMARKIKKLYAGTCQLCKNNLKSSLGYITEAHHIRPYNKIHRGDDTYLNLIVLCPNCHSRFDDFYFAIHPQTNIVHCIDAFDELHLSDLHIVNGHMFGKEYLEYAWGIFKSIKETNSG